MSEISEIKVQLRTDVGKGASRRLRRAGMVPGILYGAHQDPVMIKLVHHKLQQQLEQESIFSTILTLDLEGKKQQVLLKDLQRHPFKPFIEHIDFQRVSAREKIRTNVPIRFINEDKAVGIKMGGAISHHMTNVEVMCLPKDLPEFLEVDVLNMDIGDSVTMSGLNLPTGVEIPALAQGSEYDLPVMTVHSGHVAEEEEEEAEVEEGGEVEAAPDEE